MDPLTVIGAPLDCSGQGRRVCSGPAARHGPLVRADRKTLAAAPNLIGVSVADFNPDRDPDGEHAERVVEALRSTFRR